MTAPPITQRHIFGWKCEKVLHPILEEVLEEPLVKSSNRFNTIDFKGAYWKPELKSRPAVDERGRHQDSTTYSEWLVPTCKEALAKSLNGEGEVVFFYFWEGDNTLWYISYDSEVFKTIRRETPFWTSQEHFFIPRELFTQVEVEIPQIEA